MTGRLHSSKIIKSYSAIEDEHMNNLFSEVICLFLIVFLLKNRKLN